MEDNNRSLVKREFKHFNPPFIIRNGMVVSPSFKDLVTKIRTIDEDGENTKIVLSKSILSALGYDFEYDKFRKAECAKMVYMNLWWDSHENSYYILTLNSRAYARCLFDFQQWFCFLFCYKFKSGYDLHFLDYIIDLDRERFRILSKI
jgi:hypothetical protein